MNRSALGEILALIPAHNEAWRVAPVIGQARQYLPVLLVDDGSSDATADVARAAGAEVLRQTPNQGKGQALKAGFRHALAGQYAAVLMLDADGQHDPEEIPAFLAAWQNRGADLIIGKRDFRSMPFPRNFSNAIGRIMYGWAVGRSIEDNQSGYRLVSRRLMHVALESRYGGFEFEVDMITICIRNGWPLEEIPIRTIYGDQTSHIRYLKHIQRYFQLVWEAHKVIKS